MKKKVGGRGPKFCSAGFVYGPPLPFEGEGEKGYQGRKERGERDGTILLAFLRKLLREGRVRASVAAETGKWLENGTLYGKKEKKEDKSDRQKGPLRVLTLETATNSEQNHRIKEDKLRLKQSKQDKDRMGERLADRQINERVR